jgi:hypothetical protein
MFVGFLLIYVGLTIFRYDKSREELSFSNKEPQKLWISYSKNSEKSVLKMTNNKGRTSLSVILTDKQTSQLIQLLENEGNQISNERSFTVNVKNLTDLNFEYLYWKDRIYEILINGETIVPYKKNKTSLGYALLIIGILWCTLQLWVIYVLVTKEAKIYDESFKK